MQLAFDFVAPTNLPGADCGACSKPNTVSPVSEAKKSAQRGGRKQTADREPGRVHRGRTSYHSGLAAEQSVARAYAGTGLTVISQRFRGRYGEVDLIVRDGAKLIFVEVKKGRSHDLALSRVTRQQFGRIYAAATEFAEDEPRGQLTDMRFDVATVDSAGSVKLHPGILAHF